MHRAGDERRLPGGGAGEDEPMTKPDWEAFGREIMEAWPEGVDGFDLQDIAVRHRVVVETKFDLAKHLDDHTDAWGVRQGDPWFVRNYE